MKTYPQSEIKSAIARSTSHTEIVAVECDDTREALAGIDNDENVSCLDWSEENDGSLDVWGNRLGDQFRLRLIPSPAGYTGAICVSDGVVCYEGTLRGQWTAEQVHAAFAKGYSTTLAQGLGIDCQIMVDGETTESFTMFSDGEGGIGSPEVVAPHRVDWRG